MTKLAFAALAAALTISAPASAETLYVIGSYAPPKTANSGPVTLAERIESAINGACEKPYFRDLKGRETYKACRTEVRAQIDAKLAGTKLALR